MQESLTPTPPPLPAFLPLIVQLKELVPKLHLLHPLLQNVRPPGPLSNKAALVGQVVALLEQLPDFTRQDTGPPPPNNHMPELIVTAKGKVYLSQPLIAKLNLRAGQPINLHAPAGRGGICWYLDIRPDALLNIDWYPGKRAKVKRVDLPEGLIPEGHELMLRLLPGRPEFPGFHVLVPAGPPYPSPTKKLSA